MKKTIRGIALAMALLVACLAFTACTGAGANVHELKNENGVVLMTDDAIDTSDKDAEKKLEEYMESNNVEATEESFSSDQLKADIYAKGNTLVFEFDVTIDLTAEQETSITDSIKPMMNSIDIKEGKSQAGVDNMALVYAVVSKSGKVLLNEIMK